jgi:hypothetical protein
LGGLAIGDLLNPVLHGKRLLAEVRKRKKGKGKRERSFPLSTYLE